MVQTRSQTRRFSDIDLNLADPQDIKFKSTFNNYLYMKMHKAGIKIDDLSTLTEAQRIDWLATGIISKKIDRNTINIKDYNSIYTRIYK